MLSRCDPSFSFSLSRALFILSLSYTPPATLTLPISYYLCPQGLAPLHFAASRGSAKMVAFLLSAGAATDSKTIRQVTPLMAAAANGRTSCVKVLLDLCTSLDVPLYSLNYHLLTFNFFDTPWNWQHILLYLSTRFFLSFTGFRLQNLLCCPFVFGRWQLLLLRGASTTAEHWNGLNALNIATIHRHAAIAKLLEKVAFTDALCFPRISFWATSAM